MSDLTSEEDEEVVKRSDASISTLAKWSVAQPNYNFAAFGQDWLFSKIPQVFWKIQQGSQTPLGDHHPAV